MTVTRLVLPNFFPSQATNGWSTLFRALSTGGGLTIFLVIAGIISLLVQFGGISIFMGGFLSYKHHLRSGKELVSIGTTVGFADLLLSLTSLASFNYAPPYVLAWFGLFLGVFAGRHLHGPTSSYAGEFRKFMSFIKRGFVKEKKKTLTVAKPAKPKSLGTARPYNNGDNKYSQSKRPREKNTRNREVGVHKRHEK